ncbi:MAG TPA: cytidyltransferase [Cyanobacteria bacterium UBA9971]|nr:cytidyltransferase [Cyanobacteria bacterium UBA9971]
MRNNNKIAAFLPVKAKSERIKNKNLRLLAGKPLFLHTLEKLVGCDFIDEVFLDSESEEVFDMASNTNFIRFKRDEKLANNSTDGNKLFLNEIKATDADICIQILCTSPFIEPETIKKGVEILANSEEYDSVVLVKKEKLYTWDSIDIKPNYDIENIPNSFNLEDTVIETMGLYIIRRDAALKTGRRIGKKPYLLEAASLEAIDINYIQDFELAELVMKGKKEKEILFFRQLSSKINSSMISDTLEELNIKNKVIIGLDLNLKDKKLLGRAKTLKIKEKTDSSAGKNIYEALNSYETITSGDIIVVENELSKFAYFGNLNASLAIRSGAVGAIIGGKTRDSSEIKHLDFPVFSEGFTCKDIKNKGQVDSINKKISIKGVEICPDDLIFADNEGIVVIPKKFESLVFEKCLKILERENEIILDITKKEKISLIRQKFGDF